MMAVFIAGAVCLARSRDESPSRSPNDRSLNGRALPSVSVIVPLRNEEAHAPETLRALSLQDYSGEWEIICVNDRSSDATGAILRDICARDPRFSLVDIPVDAPKIPSTQKRALAGCFAAANGDILMTTYP